MFDTVLICLTAVIPLFGIAAAVRPNEFSQNELKFGKIRRIGIAIMILGFIINALVLFLRE